MRRRRRRRRRRERERERERDDILRPTLVKKEKDRQKFPYCKEEEEELEEGGGGVSRLAKKNQTQKHPPLILIGL